MTVTCWSGCRCARAAARMSGAATASMPALYWNSRSSGRPSSSYTSVRCSCVDLAAKLNTNALSSSPLAASSLGAEGALAAASPSTRRSPARNSAGMDVSPPPTNRPGWSGGVSQPPYTLYARPSLDRSVSNSWPPNELNTEPSTSSGYTSASISCTPGSPTATAAWVEPRRSTRNTLPAARAAGASGSGSRTTCGSSPPWPTQSPRRASSSASISSGWKSPTTPTTAPSGRSQRAMKALRSGSVMRAMPALVAWRA
mmetsp:Transcript_7826/g.19485  ORF Transcript_7826/g.19485 Transcript_7826/m.19485 type:complete len:257 (-) Transcript_7826:228-998(-)